MGMGTPISLGRIFGVNVRIDISLFLLAAFFMLDGLRDAGLRGVLTELTFVVLLFFSVFLHEFGHAAGARLYGIGTMDVTLSFFGGYARLSRPPRGAMQDAVIAFAGPLTNLLLAGLLHLWISNPNLVPPGDVWMIGRLMVANYILGIFNLLPGFPLDGGTIARSILTNFMPRNRARLIVAYIGVGIGFVFVALGLRGDSYGLFLGFLLIWIASMEVQAARSSRF